MLQKQGCKFSTLLRPLEPRDYQAYACDEANAKLLNELLFVIKHCIDYIGYWDNAQET